MEPWRHDREGADVDLTFVTSHQRERSADDRSLTSVLEARGVRIVPRSFEDPDAVWDGVGVAVVRTAPQDPDERERFVAWAERLDAGTQLSCPPDVLRWNTHRSYLLELEDRGAPIVPSAWLGRGDRIPLEELLRVRGWDDVVLRPAVGSRGVVRVDGGRVGLDATSGQHHLDVLLAHDDAVVQPWPPGIERRGRWSVVLVDGQVSHAVRTLPAEGTDRPATVAEVVHGTDLEPDLGRLAAWVAETTAITRLPVASVDLVEDAAGTPQVEAFDAVAPELYLAAMPAVASTVADAILALADP